MPKVYWMLTDEPGFVIPANAGIQGNKQMNIEHRTSNFDGLVKSKMDLSD